MSSAQLGLGLLALVLLAPLGCGGGDDGSPTRFSLKVVAKPDGKDASASCEQLGSSTGGVSGTNFTVGQWLATAAHESDGSTWYEVRITDLDGNEHAWRYDEAMARAGTVVRDGYVDRGGPTGIEISGSFARIEPCTP